MNEHAIPVEWLAQYHDGELGAARRQQVEEHLLSCAACQRELAAVKSLGEMLAAERLSEDALTDRSVFWGEVRSQLPQRSAASMSPVKWLPGVALLVANGWVQFLAAASMFVLLVQLPGLAGPLAWLDRALAGWLFGGVAWLLPSSLSSWGLVLFLVGLSAWLAVLYLVWLAYVWQHRRVAVLAG